MNGFEIIKKLGNGSYSVVYKVRRKLDNNIYALKKVKLFKLKEKERQAALNEVRILASIKSPFIISYKEAFIEESDKSLCIVMEYADDGDLYQKICQYKKMNLLMEESDIWRVFIQMVKGLKILHDLKILHRDLKSANILLFNDGTAKIGDCNVSKIFYGERDLGYTQTGTPYYASPEVWSEAPYNQKSDIWSLGIITYEMLTLNPPFKAANMEALYKKIIKGQYNKINSKYSRDIAEVVRNLLMIDPNDRPTCGEILRYDMVMERVDFFKDREGFVEEDNNSEEAKLMKSFRITKNMRFISQQLPNPNYEYPKNVNNNNSNNYKATETRINTYKASKLNKNTNNSLPNINRSLHFNARNITTKNDLKIESPKKTSFTKYKLINNNLKTKREYSNDNDKTQKHISMETENAILSYTKNNYKRMMNSKEVEKTNNDSINLSRKHLNNIHLKMKSMNKYDNKNLNGKYKKELSLINIYPEYERETKRNNNRYNIYLNRNNNYYLPNIYGNKLSSPKQRTRFKSKK